MTLYSLGDKTPVIAESAWIAPGCHIIGDVVIEDGASVWFGCTIRGDNERITIGAGSNVQENCILHTDMGFPLTIGAGCTIGHKVMLHGCTIAENSLIGMGATVLNGASIAENSLVGAGALVTENKTFEPGQLIVGMPAKAIKPLDENAIAGLKASALSYQKNAKRFQSDLRAIG